MAIPPATQPTTLDALTKLAQQATSSDDIRRVDQQLVAHDQQLVTERATCRRDADRLALSDPDTALASRARATAIGAERAQLAAVRRALAHELTVAEARERTAALNAAVARYTQACEQGVAFEERYDVLGPQVRAVLEGLTAARATAEQELPEIRRLAGDTPVPDLPALPGETERFGPLTGTLRRTEHHVVAFPAREGREAWWGDAGTVKTRVDWEAEQRRADEETARQRAAQAERDRNYDDSPPSVVVDGRETNQARLIWLRKRSQAARSPVPPPLDYYGVE